MMSIWVRAFLVGLLVAGAAFAIGTARADVSQTPVATGCPAGYDHRSVDSFHPPYYRPPLVDAAGNNNGWVCALAQPEAVAIAFCRQGASWRVSSWRSASRTTCSRTTTARRARKHLRGNR